MKKIVIAVSGLFLLALTACNKAEMPAPQTKASATHEALAREGGATPAHCTAPVSITPPKADR